MLVEWEDCETVDFIHRPILFARRLISPSPAAANKNG